MKNLITKLLLLFVINACTEKSNTDSDSLIIVENEQLKSELEILKKVNTLLKDSLSVLNEELITAINSKTDSSKEKYMYGVPPAPPFKNINLKIKNDVDDGCDLSKIETIAYVIQVKENKISNYDVTIQNENGLRSTCYFDTNSMSNADKSYLPYVLIPGNKLAIKTQNCGSGGFILRVERKNVKEMNSCFF
jgi:hypothetical protein